MGFLYAVLAWGIVALAVVHMAATFRLFPSLTGAAIWFFTGGIAMVLTGGLNLLNRAYGAAAPGLRWFCIATNVTMTAVAFVSGRVGRARLGELVFVAGWFAATAALSMLGAPLRVGRPRAL
jgi:hypothetical protein